MELGRGSEGSKEVGDGDVANGMRRGDRVVQIDAFITSNTSLN